MVAEAMGRLRTDGACGRRANTPGGPRAARGLRRLRHRAPAPPGPQRAVTRGAGEPSNPSGRRVRCAQTRRPPCRGRHYALPAVPCVRGRSAKSPRLLRDGDEGAAGRALCRPDVGAVVALRAARWPSGRVCPAAYAPSVRSRPVASATIGPAQGTARSARARPPQCERRFLRSS